MKLRISVVLAFLVLPVLRAGAQQPSAVDQARQLCPGDVEKLCKDADKNGKTLDCLEQHDNDISDECVTKFWRRYRVGKICQADFERLCKDAKPLGPCVKQHDAELSKECKAALIKGSKQQKADAKAEAKAAGTDKAAADKPAEKPAKGKKAKK
jgi:hypothetical protein